MSLSLGKINAGEQDCVPGMHKTRFLRGVDVSQHFSSHCPQSPAAGNTPAGPPCTATGWLQEGAGVEKKGQLVLLEETPYKEL